VPARRNSEVLGEGGNQTGHHRAKEARTATTYGSAALPQQKVGEGKRESVLREQRLDPLVVVGALVGVKLKAAGAPELRHLAGAASGNRR
jgi:hypothetical protein